MTLPHISLRDYNCLYTLFQGRLYGQHELSLFNEYLPKDIKGIFVPHVVNEIEINFEGGPLSLSSFLSVVAL